MMIVIDTNIMIAYLSGSKEAEDWLKAQGDEEIALPGLVVLELLDGCRDKTEIKRLSNHLMERYRMIWPTNEDFTRALSHFIQAMPESGFSIMDLLIGETAAGLGVPIHTLNLRHMSNIPGVQAVAPF
jgi:predicted nucleic acid-binding protein